MRILIGKAHDCTIRVNNDSYVSPRHCEITRNTPNGVWQIRDLGSTNGTFIRRRGKLFPNKLTMSFAMPLYTGDVIIVGRTEFPYWDLT